MNLSAVNLCSDELSQITQAVLVAFRLNKTINQSRHNKLIELVCQQRWFRETTEAVDSRALSVRITIAEMRWLKGKTTFTEIAR